jgi:protein arginine kinase
MKQNPIDHFLNSRVSWLADTEVNDIVISSRIRLARNLNGVPFPIAADNSQLLTVCDAVKAAIDKLQCLGKNPLVFVTQTMDKLDRQVLLERRLASNDFIQREVGTILLVSRDESCSIMVNEEDHLRMQVMCSGLNLEKAWSQLSTIDDQLKHELDFAWDDRLGFLTSCPTNVGTGLRVSVMLHLPALVLTNRIGAAVQGIGRLSFEARGFFGEGSENMGNLFQISNRSTLGETEEQIISQLAAVVRQLINHEKHYRMQMLEQDRQLLADFVGRSYGVLRYAYVLSVSEALNSLSALRLGVALEMFTALEMHTVNELLLIIHPAHLQKFEGRVLDEHESDILRAELVREKLKNIEKT